MSVGRGMFFCFAMLLAPGAALAEHLGPLAGQFQVNTGTTGLQVTPDLALAPDGSFLVVWSDNRDGDGKSIHAQLHDADGQKVGADFVVNTYTAGEQYEASVAWVGDGFAVVWQSTGAAGPDTDGFHVRGQRLSAAGAPVGGEFQVNSYTTDDQYVPVVGGDAEGGFVVVWRNLEDGPARGARGQRFDAEAAKLGDEFQVNLGTSSINGSPALAMTPGGGFVVVWEYPAVLAQVFDAVGNRVGDEFEVATSGYVPAVAATPGGDFVAVWADYDADGTGLLARRFDTSGALLGDVVQVNSYQTGEQVLPRVVADVDGGFVVVWQSIGSAATDVDGNSVQAQLFDPAGAKLGDQLQVNTFTSSNQFVPAVATDGQGSFVVAWQSWGSPGSDSYADSIQARRYRVVLFSDGFEGFDTCAWTGRVGAPPC